MRDGWTGREPGPFGPEDLNIPNGLGVLRSASASSLGSERETGASWRVSPGATGQMVDVMAGNAKIAIVGAGRVG